MEEVRRAGRASIGVSAISIASYALTIVRVTLVAFLFGVGRSLDAFYLALGVPLFLQGLFFGTFQSVFVPAYQRALASDPASARVARTAVARRGVRRPASSDGPDGPLSGPDRADRRRRPSAGRPGARPRDSSVSSPSFFCSRGADRR